MITTHIANKDELPDQNAYFMELLRVDRDAFGGINPEHVITIRYFVAGHLFMRQTRALPDKQGTWVASYMPDEAHALQMLREHVAIDSNCPNERWSVDLVLEATVGLTEVDLVAIDRKDKKGPDGRNRPGHWIGNHIGRPTIVDDREVKFVK